MANFGWSLCDSFNPRRTGLANFRTNFMQQRTDIPSTVISIRSAFFSFCTLIELNVTSFSIILVVAVVFGPTCWNSLAI